MSEIEDQFRQFLADNRIDTSALKGTADGDRLVRDVKDQRVISILKARLDSYPYSSYDQYRQKSDLVGHLAESLQSQCFLKCERVGTELPFLSVQEGLCFRNCLTKFSVFYPTLQVNLEHADFKHTEQQIL